MQTLPGGTRPSKRNRKIGSRFGEFGDRRTRGTVAGKPQKLPDSDRLNYGEAQIDHGGEPAFVAASRGENRRPKRRRRRCPPIPTAFS
ncbi:hypothetical protein CRG98_004439 [Punica granatum]|uniref:Uncharacterized protein n=1 Tax=Punica granatum TaxID=22663 RepID=A0A2I0L342_PUNGR|nr:hypothetical protein CRG98_004439 [Punica granatum]